MHTNRNGSEGQQQHQKQNANQYTQHEIRLIQMWHQAKARAGLIIINTQMRNENVVNLRQWRDVMREMLS